MRKIKDTTKYKTVSLPDPLMNEIKEYVKENKNYRSVAEFVKEAIRYKIIHVGFDDHIDADESFKIILKNQKNMIKKIDSLSNKVNKLEKIKTKKSGKKP